jgi:hypothetical protein
MCASSESPALITQAAEWARDRATIVLVGKIGTAFPFADCIANGASSYGTHQCTCTRCLTGYAHLGLCADLSWYGHLLVNRGAAKDVAHLLGLCCQAQAKGGH